MLSMLALKEHLAIMHFGFGPERAPTSSALNNMKLIY